MGFYGIPILVGSCRELFFIFSFSYFVWVVSVVNCGKHSRIQQMINIFHAAQTKKVLQSAEVDFTLKNPLLISRKVSPCFKRLSLMCFSFIDDLLRENGEHLRTTTVDLGFGDVEDCFDTALFAWKAVRCELLRG